MTAPMTAPMETLEILTKSYTSATNTEDNKIKPWMSLVTMANKNVEHGIDSNIADSTPDEWMVNQTMTLTQKSI